MEEKILMRIHDDENDCDLVSVKNPLGHFGMSVFAERDGVRKPVDGMHMLSKMIEQVGNGGGWPANLPMPAENGYGSETKEVNIIIPEVSGQTVIQDDNVYGMFMMQEELSFVDLFNNYWMHPEKLAIKINGVVYAVNGIEDNYDNSEVSIGISTYSGEFVAEIGQSYDYQTDRFYFFGNPEIFHTGNTTISLSAVNLTVNKVDEIYLPGQIILWAEKEYTSADGDSFVDELLCGAQVKVWTGENLFMPVNTVVLPGCGGTGTILFFVLWYENNELALHEIAVPVSQSKAEAYMSYIYDHAR